MSVPIDSMVRVALLNNLATLALIGLLIWRSESKRKTPEADAVYWVLVGVMFGVVMGGVLFK